MDLFRPSLVGGWRPFARLASPTAVGGSGNGKKGTLAKEVVSDNAGKRSLGDALLETRQRRAHQQQRATSNTLPRLPLPSAARHTVESVEQVSATPIALSRVESMSESKPVFVDSAAGSFVFREGDAGSAMYIIESGSVEVLRGARGALPIATLAAGDFFGEMAILEDQPRFASVRTVTATRLLRVDRAAFAGMLRDNFEIAVRIMRKLVARLRRTEEQLQAAHAELEVARAPQSLPTPSQPLEVLPGRETIKGYRHAGDPIFSQRIAPVDANALGKAIKLVHAESGSEFAFDTSKTEMLIGRPDPVTGLLPEINLGPLDSQRSLSRRHAKVINEGGMLFLREEVGTTNGSFVNGERLLTGQARPLAPGDLLRFGSVELKVQTLS